MGKITQLSIQKKDKERVNVYIDGEYKFSVNVDSVYVNRLKVGDEIDEKSILNLTLDGEKSQGLAKGIAYVSKTMKTKRQVREYLQKKGYSDNVVYYVLDKLCEYKYIDDREYAKKYVESLAKNQGKMLMNYKLMSRGISRDVINDSIAQANIDLKENAKILAEKRLKNKEITKELLLKTYKYLLGRGFSYEEADYAISFFREN